MKLHRNTPKRFYVDGAPSFITTVTHDRYPYFNNDLLCELFLMDLGYCRSIYNFILYGYKINPDHVHLLFLPGAGSNYSQVMKSLKENFSRNANKLIGKSLNGIKYKNNVKNLGEIPPFQWQKSFYNRIIFNKNEFQRVICYIERQWIKHNLDENRWCFADDSWG